MVRRPRCCFPCIAGALGPRHHASPLRDRGHSGGGLRRGWSLDAGACLLRLVPELATPSAEAAGATESAVMRRSPKPVASVIDATGVNTESGLKLTPTAHLAREAAREVKAWSGDADGVGLSA